MVDDRPEDTGASPDTGRARREPPTIDLEATEVSGETQAAAAAAEPGSEPEPAAPLPPPPPPRASTGAMSAALIAAFSGASAAALALGAAWFAGWPAPPPAAPAPQVNSLISSAAVDDLAARVASIEKAGKSAAAPDPAAAARADALEKSLAALRGELATQRAQSDKLASSIGDVKAAPQAAAAPDLSAVNERIAQVERAVRAQSAEITKESGKPADDVPLRRIVAASLLDVLVRAGDPYPAALGAAKTLAPNPEALKSLESFAVSGVPSANSLSRELLTLVPKLSPPAADNPTTGTGIVDRLQAGAAKLVRIERSDGVGSDRGAIVSRVTAAALRNDLAEARRELKTLEPADRAAAQAWLDKADARDAALAASRQFATEAMAALAKPAQ